MLKRIMFWALLVSTCLLMAGCFFSTRKADVFSSLIQPMADSAVPLELTLGPVEGEFQIRFLSRFLVGKGVLAAPVDDDSTVLIDPIVFRYGDLCDALRSQGWWLHNKLLSRIPAVDERSGADDLGFATTAVENSVRLQAVLDFRVVSAGVSADYSGGSSVSGGASGTMGDWSLMVPIGAETVYSSTAQRSDTNQLGSVQSGVVFATTQSSVSAGLSLDIRVGILAGKYCRLRGSLSDTSFEGGSTDVSGQSLQINCDIPLNKWVPLAKARAVGGSLVFPNITGGLSAADSVVLVRVRPIGF